MLTQDERKLIIIKSLGENYPIIRHWGCEPSKLLVLHVQEGQMKKVIAFLSNKYTSKIDSFTSMKSLQKILTEDNALVICSYSSGKVSDELVSKLAMIVKTGICRNQNVTSFPLVVMEGVLYGFPREEIFSIYFDGDIESLVQNPFNVIPPDEQVPVVADQLEALLRRVYSSEKKALLAATSFLYPNLKKSNAGEHMDVLLQDVEEMVRQDEDNKALIDIETTFIKELYCWQDINQFADVYELPYLGINSIKNIKSSFFYDSKYVYMSDCMFKRVAQKMIEVFSCNVIKNELTKAGIIRGDGAGTYTAKMSYVDLVGTSYRERMIRMERKKLEVLGEIDFIEQCESRKGGHT